MKKELRIQVYNKYKGHCSYCGKEIEYKDMQVDHIIPKHTFDNIKDADYKENYNPSCRRCNYYKGGESIEAFRNWMKTIHERIQLPFLSRVGLDYGIMVLKPFNGVFYFEKNVKNL